MNYSLTNKYGFIRSKTDVLSSDENYSSRRREDYEPPEPYIPLDKRFYKYAGIEHPTITLDPQAYKRRENYKYFEKAGHRDLKEYSSSEESQQYEGASSQSSDGNCYAHHELPKARTYYKHEESSSFELSPYEESDDSFSREHDYRNSYKERREKQLMKQTSKGMREVMEESEELDYSGDSSALRIKEEENHRKSIDKIQKARNIVKEKLIKQEYEKRGKVDSSESESGLESARFNDGLTRKQINQREQYAKKTRKNNYVESNSEEYQESEEEYKKRESKDKKEKKKERKRITLEDEQLVSKYQGRQFANQDPRPILRKPPSEQRQKSKQKSQHEIRSKDQSVQVQEIVKENNPENRKYKLLKEKQEKKPPVAFDIDNYRDDLTLAEAFKMHCGDLRHKLKEEREEFKGNHEHQKKARRERKRNASKTRTFVKNKFKSTNKYSELGAQTHYNPPFTGKNNPLEEFKRMDIIRRRQLMKKYDKANRLRLRY